MSMRQMSIRGGSVSLLEKMQNYYIRGFITLERGSFYCYIDIWNKVIGMSFK